jgi:TadE-like protein
MSALGQHPLPSRHTKDRGAAALEFALVFPLFVMLTFGMISAGFAFFYDIQLTQAARDAARYGSTFAMDTDRDTGLDDMAKIAAQQSGWPDVDNIDSEGLICVAYIGGAAGGSERRVYGPGPQDNLPAGDECVDDDQSGLRVQVVIRRGAEINGVLFAWDVTLGTTSVIPWERRETPPSP